MHTGKLPKAFIDHINGNPGDNAIENLREATQAENNQNIKGAQKNNSGGILGVRKRNQKWAAEICSRGIRYRLGRFATPEEARNAYLEAKRVLHPFNTL
jgi:HNH endonuclease/AP2 domain